jgi:hypothetical protein
MPCNARIALASGPAIVAIHNNGKVSGYGAKLNL